MDYPLAKKLADAGFQIEDGKGYWKRVRYGGIRVVDTVNIPTLEELIEACGTDFLRLEQRLKNSGETWDWCAHSHKNIPFIEECSTPSEAVARLWLALNKK